MSKITFRADDDLVERLEALEVSKSEAMREALRAYLEGDAARSVTASDPAGGEIDELVRELVDERLASRLDDLGLDAGAPVRESNAGGPRDVNVTVSLADGTGHGSDRVRGREEERTTTGPQGGPEPSEGRQCNQCGDELDGEHVYCPNCGEKATRRLFCDCGDEIRTDWSFCPSCGRRTPAADVLESDSHQY
jgi:hypothetical protein